MKHKLVGNNEREVYLDGLYLSPRRSQEYRNHSPDGFNWGYEGSGSAQLALAIVLHLTGKSDGYQDFKRRVIAHIPMGEFQIEFEIVNPPDEGKSPSTDPMTDVVDVDPRGTDEIEGDERDAEWSRMTTDMRHGG